MKQNIKNKIRFMALTFLIIASSTTTVFADGDDALPLTSPAVQSKAVAKCEQSPAVKELRFKAADSEEDPLKRLVKKGDICEVVTSEEVVSTIVKDPENSKIGAEFLKGQVAQVKAEAAAIEARKLSFDRIVEVVMSGEYGNGAERRERLEAEGYDFDLIQAKVIELTPEPEPEPEQVTHVASESRAVPEQTNGNVIQAYPHVTFKSYMAWTALSSSSPQGQLSAKSTPDSSTGIMMYQGRYLVALGFAYADHIGQHIDIVMKSGQVIPAIVGDFKAKAHTDQWNSASLNNGSIIEFVVESNSAAARATNGAGSYDAMFPGEVREFRK